MKEGRYGRVMNEVRGRREDQLEETGGRRSLEALEAAVEEEEEEKELEKVKDEKSVNRRRYTQRGRSREARGHERHLGASKFRLPAVLAGYLPPIACPV